MNKHPVNKLCLGTAQLGMNYGIANRGGKVAKKEAFEILRYADKSGVNSIDTDYSYGESEETIGEFLSESHAHFDIISKMPNIKNDDISLVRKYFEETLKRLGVSSVYGYLAHNPGNVLKREGAWAVLEFIKRDGLAKKIGISLYTPAELELVLGQKIAFDIIQLPYNIFDRRFEGYFSMLRARGVDIYVRSVFLQGLFFLDEERISRDFRTAQYNIDEMRRIAEDHDISVQTLCLCFVMLNPLIDKVVIGVDSLAQLKENIASIEQMHEVKKIYSRLGALELHDENVILPYKWQ